MKDMDTVRANTKTLRSCPKNWGHFTISRNVLERLLLFTIAFLPPICVLPGKFYGKYVFTIYREPKLYLICILTWLLVTIGRSRKSVIATGLMALALISLCSLLWAPVKEAVLYESFQFINLAALSAMLAFYFEKKDHRFIFLTGLFLANIVVLVVGLCQWFGLVFPMLVPIRFSYPSTLGARHSTALAMCGSFFLNMVPIVYFFQKNRYLIFYFLLVPVGLQLFYILILGSRTGYFGLLMGALVWSLIDARRFSFVNKKGLPLMSSLVFLVLASSFILILIGINQNGYVENRLKKTVCFAERPGKFLETERWIWWKNSLRMFRENPLGVGSGNWGIVYPVYRKFGKYVYFNQNRQVRRAHNDYIQVLTELGLQGVTILLLLLYRTLQWSWRVYSKTRSIESIFLSVQLIVWMGLMCFDYPFEMPFHRFLLVITMLLIEGNYNEAMA